jgi:hypothetical protein
MTRRIPLHVYHRRLGTPAHRGNSFRAIRKALAHGYTGIDIDVTMTSDGVLIANHWQRLMRFDGFYDPSGRLDRNRKVKDLTWGQVSRLRTRDREPYRVHELYGMFVFAAGEQVRQRARITLCLEIKPGDARLFDPFTYRRIANYAEVTGVNVIVMAQGRGDLWRVFKPAAEAGLTTMVQWRGKQPPAHVAEYVKLAKYGRVVRTR